MVKGLNIALFPGSAGSMGVLITLVDINFVGGAHQLSGALFKAQKKAQPYTQMYVARGYITIASGYGKMVI